MHNLDVLDGNGLDRMAEQHQATQMQVPADTPEDVPMEMPCETAEPAIDEIEAPTETETSTETLAGATTPMASIETETSAATVSPLATERRLRKDEYTAFKAQVKLLFSQIDVDAIFEGDLWYQIPTPWLQAFLETDFGSLHEAKSRLGPINYLTLIDSYGVLVATATLTPIPTEALGMVSTAFGVVGDPIESYVIQDNGHKVMENFPPVFEIHTLQTSVKVVKRYSVTALATVGDLLAELKQTNGILSEIRLWLLENYVSTSKNHSFTLEEFVNVESKTLLSPKDYHRSLRDINLLYGHLVIDTATGANTFASDAVPSSSEYGGVVGLNNLGNSCYMNSALQCLIHLPELCLYFKGGNHTKELNPGNPLGMNGKVANAFGALIQRLFSASSHDSYAPREFKNIIGHYGPMFHGYQQQDSQEFLAFLLDGLHEDLNRILKKPYVEKPELEDAQVTDLEAIKQLAETCWEQHRMRNDSVVVDLFVGLYKSTLVCPECDKVSITFDPFNDLTLPLPVENLWSLTVKVFLDAQPLQTLDVELAKSSSFKDLKRYVAEKTAVDASELYCFEVYGHDQFYRDFQRDDSVGYMPISTLISTSDEIYFYQIKKEVDDIIVPVFNVIGPDPESTYRNTTAFAFPYFVAVTPDETHSFGKIRMKLEAKVSQLSTYTYFHSVRDKFGLSYKVADFPLLMNGGKKVKAQSAVKEADNVELGDAGNAELGDAGNVELEETDNVESGDTVMKDVAGDSYDETSDAYDSDISLANPNISGNFAFDIKIFDHTNDRRKYNWNKGSTDASDVWVPNSSNFGNLPSMLDLLPPRKKQFYMHDNLEKEINSIDESQSLMETNLTEANLTETILEVKQGEEATSTENVSPEYVMVSSNTPSEEVSSDGADQSFDLFNDPPNALTHAPEAKPSVAHAGLLRSPLVKFKQALVCEWSQDYFDVFFTGLEEEGGIETFSNPKPIPNAELEAKRALAKTDQTKNISLSDCLELFSKPEVLGEQDLWYCPNCKDHRQATKTIELWKTPDILTIHLKRFEGQGRTADKIDAVVDFPVEGLDMLKYVVNQETGEALVYDLCAVDNHFGGLGGGHYTAYVKNFVDGKWYYFDDSRVTETLAEKSIAGSAYLLFYRKRTEGLLGGERLAEMIKASEEIAQTGLEHRAVLVSNIINQNEAYRSALEALGHPEEANQSDSSETGTEVDELRYSSEEVCSVNCGVAGDHLPDSENEMRRKQRLLGRHKKNKYLDDVVKLDSEIDSVEGSVCNSPFSPNCSPPSDTLGHANSDSDPLASVD
ncbi:hypothetical protein BABINDRAFT_160205 [Babjeviella inositovora NRRL Y-12698]|uniref:ubiquitinyl hydrolase 1 n=1 Tax=Babjeviella inositovora NRRL Y-12698 TaxID=984486 RepID=A0A1E3QWI6_9ASCO|nr:uncharacterized protein BABINDRAFT_160205 [Babjeviella inositovora NRRL Y-12698]ODQ81991.1 hypothetical protein BABINDRAFT_160205 [Babjeviella inositovora NRRL Y-12698]